MKQIHNKSIIFFIINFILLFTQIVYGSLDQTFVDVGATMTVDRTYNEVVLNILNTDVKMTQDDAKYYFEVSQDMVNWTTMSSSYELIYIPEFIVSDRSDLSTLKVYVKEAMNTLERTEKVYFHEYYGGSRDLLSHYYRDSKGNVKTSFDYVNYYISNTILVYNNKNVEKISINKTGSGNIGETFNMNAKFSIKKDSISALRYFSFIFNRVYNKVQYNGSYTSDVRCGVTNYAIDLMQYIDCEHEYEVRECDNEKHIVYCNKCEWLRNGPHNYELNYDDIDNNECICGFRKQVRLTHMNNINELVIENIATPNEIIQYEDDYIKGHTLLYYEDLELLENDWNLATKSIIATMPNTVPLNSHKYKAIYKTNSYYIEYSNENNLNLKFDNQMETKKITYGEKYNLDKNLYIKKGYNFLGWSIRPDITKEVFSDMEEIENLTDVDNSIVTLHPVFSPYEYNIHYIDYRYGKDYYKKYLYNQDEALDINYNLHNTDTFCGFKINGKTIYIKRTSEIIPYILNDNDTIILEANYNIDYNEHEIITEDSIKVLSESNDANIILNNQLPIIVEQTDISNNNTTNNVVSNKERNKYKDYDFDKGIVDVFLSGNIKVKNKINNVNIINNKWMKDVNQIIVKIKKLLNENYMLKNAIKVIISIIIILIILFIILIIVYYIKKRIKEAKIEQI